MNTEKKPKGALSRFTEPVRKGDLATRLTVLISGFGNFARGQYVKGAIFLCVQAISWLGLIFVGLPYLRDLGTLGTHERTQVFDEVEQIYIMQQGDNSMLILLYSVFILAFILACLFVHYTALKSAYTAQLDKAHGKKPTGIKTDLRNLFDKNMHTTMLTLPTVGAIAFTVLPILFMICLAFTNFDRFHQPPGNLFTWVGLQNFSDMLSGGSNVGAAFFRILGWTLIWAVCATFLNYFFGMIIALMINKKGIRLKSIWRTSFVIAIAVPGFVTLLFMRQVLGDMGALNTLLQNLGIISEPVKFLTSVSAARITVIVVNLWIGIPYTILITSGLLMNIPADLYEAARIDGAGVVRQFRSVTLPFMLAATTPYLITQFIANINNFNAIFFLTAGDPKDLANATAGKTDLLITWLYKLTVTYQDYNLASVIGIITFVICGIIALLTYNLTASAKKEDTFK